MAQKAVVMLDPLRRAEQAAFVSERAQVLLDSGDHLWVRIESDDLADRMAAQGIIVQVHEEADLIDLPAVVFSVDDGEPGVPPDLAAAPPAGSATAYYIVKFVAPPLAGWLQEVEHLGDMVEDVPFYASIFKLTAASASQVRALPFVAFLGLYHPAYGLHYTLAGRSEPFTAATLRELAVNAELVVDRPSGGLQVAPFLDVTTADLAPLITATGATVVTDTGVALIINAPVGKVRDILRVPGVRLVQMQEEGSTDNQRAGLISGVNQVRNLGAVDFLVNLDGTGEIAGVIDSGLDTGVIATLQADLAGRVLQIATLNAGGPLVDTAPHGTHVVGTIVASGVNAPPPTPASPNNTVPRGIAPNARIIFHATFQPPPAVGQVFTNYLNGFNTAYAGGARVLNNSWGFFNNSAWDNDSEQIDRFAFVRSDCTILFTAGNRERDLTGNGVLDMSTLRNTCLPKNVLAIGMCESQTNLDGDARNYRVAFGAGFNHLNFNAIAGAAAPFSMSDNANEVALNSARGHVAGNPVGLQRIKPDLVAPGKNIISTGPPALLPFLVGDPRRPATAPSAFYWVNSGTSMACPHVAGACLLVRQFYRTRFTDVRRPLLVERLTVFVDQPAAIFHSAGALVAWVHPDAAAGPHHLVAARFSKDLVQQGNVVRLLTDVGAQPAISLIRHGTNAVVLRRAVDNTLRLSLFDDALASVNGFGTAGSVTLAPASRTEAARRPTLTVRQDEVGVVWFETGTDNLRFQRFNALTGAAIDTTSRILGTGTAASPHRYLNSHDDRWAAVWTRISGANQELSIRLVDAAGTVLGTQPTVLITQAQALREPVIVWDAAAARHLVAYVTESVHAGGDIHVLRVRADGTADGAAVPVISVTGTQSVRRPRLAVQTGGNVYVLLWEDDSQGTFDVYAAVFDFSVAPVHIRRRVQISDTPLPTAGFAALIDGDGIQPVWYANDEINSDQLGVYTLRLTPQAVFQTQADPRTPLLQGGHYVAHRLFEHGQLDFFQVALAWGGADFYALRITPDAGANVTLVRTNPDGREDTRMVPRTVTGSFSFLAISLHWAGNRLIACASDPATTVVTLLDLDGNQIRTFGLNGTVLINELAIEQVTVQAGHRFVTGNLRVHVAWGRKDSVATPTRLRYTVLRTDGTAAVAARDLVVGVAGTARHGWFHALDTEAPFHVVAIWHIVVNGNFAVRLNRFQNDGTAQVGHAAPIDLNAPAGDSMNAVLAPRPVAFAPPLVGGAPPAPFPIAPTRRREFGVAWQFRPNSATPWQIMFSRLNRDGTVQATRNVPIFAAAAFNATNPQMVWHTDGYGIAWLQEPAAGGARRLVFTILDQNGNRVQLNPPPVPAGPPPAPIIVPDFVVSSATAEVRQFQLVWNGRVFRACWTEMEGGRLRQMQRSIAVPRLAGFDRAGNPRTPSFDEPFQEPSSALVRATLINGATNIANTPLPNFPGIGVAHQPLQGYGWGRLNMRQALAPAPPVTFHVRDDASVAQGRTARYVFFVPPGTLLIRVTLCWTDPPGRNLVNNLNLVVTTPAFAVGGVRSYVGNRWQAAAGPLNNPQPSNPLAAPRPAPVPANTFQNVNPVEQVVITAPPALPAGDYIVEVVGTSVPDSAFQQFPGQPFSLVFVGSGNELRTVLPLAAGPLPAY